MTSHEKIKSQKPITNVNDTHKESLSKIDKIALYITERVGSMGFFFCIFIWTVSWLSWNMFAPNNMRFDTYPAFVLWLFMSNMIQIFLMPLIMIGQNIQSKHSEIQAEAHYKNETKSEQEIELIINKIDELKLLIEDILEYQKFIDKNSETE